MIPRVLTVIAVLGGLSAAAWALWPLGDNSLARDAGAKPVSSDRAASAAGATAKPMPAASPLDQSVFRTPLWVSPPPPPPPLPPPPPPPPLKLQLLAIVGGGTGAFKAMIYDPDRDAVVTVGAGDALGGGGRVVERVDASSVSIRDAVPGAGSSGAGSNAQGLVRTLTLDASSTTPQGFGGVR